MFPLIGLIFVGVLPFLCALVDKRERRRSGFEPDYVGFALDQGFLVGYGLDFAERYRNLPAIYNLQEQG